MQIFFVLHLAGHEFFDVGFQNPVFARVVSHQSLPIFALHVTTMVGAQKGPAGRQGGLDSVLEMLTH